MNNFFPTPVVLKDVDNETTNDFATTFYEFINSNPSLSFTFADATLVTGKRSSVDDLFIWTKNVSNRNPSIYSLLKNLGKSVASFRIGIEYTDMRYGGWQEIPQQGLILGSYEDCLSCTKQNNNIHVRVAKEETARVHFGPLYTSAVLNINGEFLLMRAKVTAEDDTFAAEACNIFGVVNGGSSAAMRRKIESNFQIYRDQVNNADQSAEDFLLL
jgi:hypothetical protein